jgi:hypothetical protein
VAACKDKFDCRNDIEGVLIIFQILWCNKETDAPVSTKARIGLDPILIKHEFGTSFSLTKESCVHISFSSTGSTL